MGTSTKTDVYAFGAFILEVTCGRRPVEPELSGEKQYLVKWVCECWRRDSLLKDQRSKIGWRIIIRGSGDCKTKNKDNMRSLNKQFFFNNTFIKNRLNKPLSNQIYMTTHFVYHEWSILNYPKLENHNLSCYLYSSLIFILSHKTLMPWYILLESAPSFLGCQLPYIPRRVKVLWNLLSISFSIPHNCLDHDLVSFKLLNRSSRQLIFWTGTILNRLQHYSKSWLYRDGSWTRVALHKFWCHGTGGAIPKQERTLAKFLTIFSRYWSFYASVNASII